MSDLCNHSLRLPYADGAENANLPGFSVEPDFPLSQNSGPLSRSMGINEKRLSTM